MSKVTVEVENGSILWAQIMLQEGKCVTNDELEFSDEGVSHLLYLEWADDRICLYGMYENGDIVYYDYRELCDLPDTGYRIINITEQEIKFIDNQIFDLTCKLTALELRKEKLLKKVDTK